MTKEEKIREAWGDKYDEYNPDENGWGLKIACDYLCKIDYSLFSLKTVRHDGFYIRPKSLQGIENNNGWIPYIGNSIGYYDLVYTDVGNIYPYAVFVSYDSICFVQKITHYQPIQKPNPPIY